MRINLFRKWTTWFYIFLLLFSIGFAWTNSSYPGDNAASRMALVESLLERGAYAIDRSPYFSNVDAAYYNGHYYTGKQPFLSVYTAAVLYPIHFFLKFRTEMEARILYVLAVLFSSGLASLALFIFLKKSLSIAGSGEEIVRWLTFFIFLASGILPYGGLFVSHMVEAVLIFGCFYFLLRYRQSGCRLAPVYCGILVSFSSLVHILIGTIFAGLTAIYFLTENFKDFIKYSICVLAIVCLGLGVNYLEHKSVVPFDFMLDSYLFKNGAWLNYPHDHRITDGQIRKRLDELGISPLQREKTVAIYTNFRNRVGTMWQYAVKRYWITDYLTFNPLFFAGLLSLVLLLFQKDFLWKKEALWVLFGTWMTYVALLYLRQNPGSFNGNRYLVPISPLILFFLSFTLAKQKLVFSFTKLVFWIVFPMFLTFFILSKKPFPSIHFIYVNVAVTIFLYAVCLAVILTPWPVKKTTEKKAGFLFSTRWIAGVLVVLWFFIQLEIYKGF